MNTYIRYPELNDIFTLDTEGEPAKEIWLFLQDKFGEYAEKDEIKKYIQKLESYKEKFSKDGFIENLKEMNEKKRLLEPLKAVIDVLNAKYADVVLIF